jgi:hypothetical protein
MLSEVTQTSYLAAKCERDIEMKFLVILHSSRLCRISE